MRRRECVMKSLMFCAAVILVIVGAMMVVLVCGRNHTDPPARKRVTEATLEIIETAIKNYSRDTGALPTRLQDLQVQPVISLPWNGPYLRSQYPFLDGWGHSILYCRLANSDVPNGVGYVLVSRGRNGKVGGEGLDEDTVRPVGFSQLSVRELDDQLRLTE